MACDQYRDVVVITGVTEVQQVLFAVCKILITRNNRELCQSPAIEVLSLSSQQLHHQPAAGASQPRKTPLQPSLPTPHAPSRLLYGAMACRPMTWRSTRAERQPSRLSSAGTSSMPNAFVSLGLVVLCAAAYMHLFQPTDKPPLPPAPHASAPSPTPPSAQASSPEALTSPHTSTTPQETPTSSLSAEARRVQSIIDLKVKEAGGPQYVTKLDLVSASALNMKRENRR